MYMTHCIYLYNNLKVHNYSVSVLIHITLHHFGDSCDEDMGKVMFSENK